MKLKALAVGIALASLVSYSASAVTLNSVYTGATPDSTLSYTLSDNLLTLFMEGESTTEFISKWGFTLNTTDLTGLGVNFSSTVAAPSLSIPGHPSLNPLDFQFSLDFQTSAGPGRFGVGDSISINLPAGAEVRSTGAHVQGIAGGLSGKVTVPEPSAALAGLLALGLGVVLKRRMS
jgi:hypothetical protein